MIMGRDMEDRMTGAWIRERVQRLEYLISQHAEMERRNDALSLSDIERALLNGMPIEDYPDTGRGPSCLVCGSTNDKMVHVVCGRNSHSWLVIITVYVPSMPKWKTSTERNHE
jgi:hypothetical protein